MTYSTLKLCSGRGAFEAVPRPRLQLDLPAVAHRLREQGIGVTDARVMLIVALAREVTLSQDGRVLIKSGDPVEAGRVFDELRQRAGLPSEPPEDSPQVQLPARLIPP